MIRPLFYSLCLAALNCGALSAQTQPNVIFFLVDDLGYGDIGCFWQDQRSATKKFDTPALDKMAAEGAKMTHHYVSASVCAPARASFLQGRHQGHSDVRDSQFDKALPANHTIASVLKASGYRTIHIGKDGLAGGEGSTSLGGSGSQNLASHPLDRGFDRFFGYLFHSDGHEHYPQNGTTDKVAHIYDDYQQVTDASLDLYTTDAWTAAAKKEIIDEATDGDDQPFFLYLAYDTPHFKMQVPSVAYPALDTDGNPLTGGIQWTTATDGSGKVRYANTATGNTGAIDSYYHPDIPSGWGTSEKQHVGMIRRIDNSIADILQTLEDLGIDDNTLCVFTSDNGPHNEGNNPRTFESFANMEGIKRDMWEAGIRVPTIVRWPGQIAGATGDENSIHEISYPAAVWDWMPTFVEMAGGTSPAWCDGVSLLPTLTGTGTQRDKGYLYFEFQAPGSTPSWTEFPNHGGDTKGQMQAIRIGDHMGIRTGISSGSEAFEIYDVTTDPGQATNLAGSLPAVQTQMQSLAVTARRPGAGVSRPYDSTNLPAVTAGVEPGLEYASYEGDWSWVPEFQDLTPAASGDAADLDLSVRSRADDVGLLFTGFVNVPAAGSYTFFLTSDDGADLFVHDAHVIDDDFNHNGSEQSGAVNLAAGLHPIRLYYRHNTVQPHALSLQWQGPSLVKQAVPASAFYREGTPPPEPQANDDNASTDLSTPANIAVLGNDFDDGQPSPLSIDSFTQPTHGIVSQSGDSLVYTPDGAFIGIDTFTYTVTDGEFADTATVSVTVTAVSFAAVARWPMEEGSGTTTSTRGGILSDAFGTGIAWSTDTAGIGSAASLSFPGTAAGNFATNLDAQDLGIDGSGAKTITGWIKTSNDFYGMFFGWSPAGGGGPGENLRLGFDTGGRLRFEVSSGFARYDTTALNDGNWHMVGVVIEPGDNVNSVQFYIDGTLVNPTTAGDRAINTTGTGPPPLDEIGLGVGTLGGGLYWSGLLDEVRVFDAALDLTTLDSVRAEMFTQQTVVWGGAGSEGVPEFWNLPVNGSPGRNDDPTHWNQVSPPDMTGVDIAIINGGGIKKNFGLAVSNSSSMTLNSGGFFLLTNSSIDNFSIASGASLVINDGIFDSNTAAATIAGSGSLLEVGNGSFILDSQSTGGLELSSGARAIVRAGGVIESDTFFNSQSSSATSIGGDFILDGGTLRASGAEANPIRASSGLDGGGFDFIGLGGKIQIDNFTGGDLTTYLTGKATTGFFKIDGTTVAGFGTGNAVNGEYLALTDDGSSGSLVLTTLSVGFAGWISGYPVGAEDGLNDNPDFGRLVNGLEFLLGGNPTVANDTSLPVAVVDGSDLVFTFDRDDQSIGALDVVVELSSDLVTWPIENQIVIGADTGSSGSGVTIIDQGATDAVEVRIPKASDFTKFVRIRVSLPGS